MSANPGKLAEDHARSRLGRGLAALIGDMAAETSVERPRGQRRLPTAALRPNPRNPRRAFPNAENVQRADLNPLEEAEGYRALIEEFGNSQDEIAKIVGKSRSHVANTLRLLKLPETIKAYIHSGKLFAGHARMLIGQPDAERLAEEIVAHGLNVRQVENLAREAAERGGKSSVRAARRAAKNANLVALEKRISDALGLAVSINEAKRGGVLTIRYRSLDQLDDVLRRLEKR
jgi:ParB family chromosome partitioning protein